VRGFTLGGLGPAAAVAAPVLALPQRRPRKQLA
jgi:hypothetical protein